MQTERKAVIAKRHMQILNFLLEKGEVPLNDVFSSIEHLYKGMKAGAKATVRDLIHLLDVGAIKMRSENSGTPKEVNFLSVNLDWPKEITQTGFMEKAKKMPKSKAYSFLTSAN